LGLKYWPKPVPFKRKLAAFELAENPETDRHSRWNEFRCKIPAARFTRGLSWQQ
jgi:hypothetical protein